MNNNSPYNKNNFLISSENILNILNKFNINDFKIKDISLFQKCFIHESYTNLKCYSEYKNSDNCLPLQNESYERLEFLGDSFIGCITAEYLYERYHKIYNVNEGFMTKLRTRIVMGKTLTYLSYKMGLHKYIIISDSIESKYNGRNNMGEHKILCDVLESFCGALYLNSDFNTLKSFFINIIESFIDFSELILNDINYKDQLSRYIRKTYNYTIKYDTIKDKDLIYECSIKDKDNITICKYNSEDKKEAEQECAKLALKYYNILN
tara:strand:- start:554 stop:1348 length:795 start_codon:yes stop_codon:yes gene_type:complete